MLNKAVPYLVCLAIGAFLGGIAVDRHHRGAQPVYKPEERTAPGDVVLETKPGAKPKLPAPTKPKGGKTTGTVEIEIDGGSPVRVDPVQKPDKSGEAIPSGKGGAIGSMFPVPKPGTNDSQSDSVVKECLTAQDFTCPPVRVRLDLGIRDGQQYVAVRTEDGQEVNGVFIPRAGMPVVPRYTATAIIGDSQYTATVARNLGRFSIGAGLSVNDGVAAPVAVVSYGF